MERLTENRSKLSWNFRNKWKYWLILRKFTTMLIFLVEKRISTSYASVYIMITIDNILELLRTTHLIFYKSCWEQWMRVWTANWRSTTNTYLVHNHNNKVRMIIALRTPFSHTTNHEDAIGCFSSSRNDTCVIYYYHATVILELFPLVHSWNFWITSRVFT